MGPVPRTTVRDQHGVVRARIQKLKGGWTDNWDLTLVGAKS